MWDVVKLVLVIITRRQGEGRGKWKVGSGRREEGIVYYLFHSFIFIFYFLSLVFSGCGSWGITRAGWDVRMETGKNGGGIYYIWI